MCAYFFVTVTLSAASQGRKQSYLSKLHSELKKIAIECMHIRLYMINFIDFCIKVSFINNKYT